MRPDLTSLRRLRLDVLRLLLTPSAGRAASTLRVPLLLRRLTARRRSSTASAAPAAGVALLSSRSLSVASCGLVALAACSCAVTALPTARSVALRRRAAVALSAGCRVTALRRSVVAAAVSLPAVAVSVVGAVA